MGRGLPNLSKRVCAGVESGISNKVRDYNAFFFKHPTIGQELAKGMNMILVVTPNLRAEECAEALRLATSEEIVLAESLRKAIALLRSKSFLAIVLDQYLLETEADETETVMQHLGTAIPLQVNFAISGIERLTREVRAAVRRRTREEVSARRAAASSLHSELNGTVTALLLSCELVLGSPGLPLGAAEKMQSAHELVKQLRLQLESSMAGA